MVIKMRSLGISAISIALTAAVVGNAYYQKKQFYPSVVYITKSNPSMTVSIVPHKPQKSGICSSIVCIVKNMHLQYPFSFLPSLSHRLSTCNRWCLCWCWENWWEKYVKRNHSISDSWVIDTTLYSIQIDFPGNTARCRIRAFDGTILVRIDWNVFGIHRFPWWFQSEICGIIHGALVSEVIPLAGRGESGLCEWPSAGIESYSWIISNLFFRSPI